MLLLLLFLSLPSPTPLAKFVSWTHIAWPFLLGSISLLISHFLHSKPQSLAKKKKKKGKKNSSMIFALIDFLGKFWDPLGEEESLPLKGGFGGVYGVEF